MRRVAFVVALLVAACAFGQEEFVSRRSINSAGGGSGLPAGGLNGKWLGFSGGSAGWLDPLWIPLSTGTTNGDILYFNGTSWVRLGAGSNGNVLTLSGGVPSWAASSAGIPLSTVTANGDIIIGTGNGTVARLGAGSNGQVLTISGGIPAWADPTSSSHITLQSSMPGAPDVGGLNLTLGGVFGDSVSVDGNIDATGLVSGLQIATSGVRLLDRRIENNLGATTPAYSLHQIGTARHQAIATPSAPTVTNVGTTGSTTYTYYVVCKDEWGNRTLPSTPTSTTTGNATLNSSNYNIVDYTVPDGATSCDVLKGSTAALAANVLAPLHSYNDQGAATSAYTAPVRNATADITVDTGLTVGPLSVNSNAFAPIAVTSNPLALITSASNGTDTTLSTIWSAAKFTASTTEIGGVSVWLKTTGSPAATDNITAYLYTDSAGVPGSAVADSGLTSTGQPTVIRAGGLTTSYAQVNFRLPATTLVVGTSYWIVLKASVASKFVWDGAAAGSNLYATAADSGGSPGSWTGAGKSMRYVVNGSSGDGINVWSQNNHAVRGRANEGFGGFFESSSGGGLKANSDYNFGVGGFSTYSQGVRGTSTHDIGVQGISQNSAGGQFQALGSGVGVQVVANTAAAAQVISSGLLIQGLNAAAGYAQTFAVTNDGYFFSTTPFTLFSTWLNGLASVQTIGGHLLPAHAFTVNQIDAYVSATASGAGNTVIRISDGTNNCDATFSCTADSNTTGPKGKTTTGQCAFSASAALTLSVQTAGCATTQPTIKNIGVIGIWQ